jgi:diadenosine tetraphosphate (Ap4A) HIT family hydrolase
MGKEFVNPENTSFRPDGVYRQVIDKIKDDGVCPFCPEQVARYHKKPIIADGRYWILTDNMYPYKGAKHHILLIHKMHIETITNISPEAWSELLELTHMEAKKRAIAGGTFYLRFGDTSYTGASVIHLHANLISSDMSNKDREPIFMRVG